MPKIKPIKKNSKGKILKLNKYEKLFVKIHGAKLYNQLRASRSDLRKSPQLFRMMLQMGKLFGVEFYLSFIEGDEEVPQKGMSDVK